MAKRFTDTDKYKKHFLRGLQGAYKLLWDYICNDCNHAGIWIVDFEIAHIYLGKDVNVERNAALRFFNADKIRVIELDGGTRWFIVSFIEFQYGQLNPQNRAHSSVITALKSYGLWDDDKNELIINKPHISPLQGAMDMDKEKEMDKDMDNGGLGETVIPAVAPDITTPPAEPTLPPAIPPTKPIHQKYAEYVRMTESEYKLLCTRYGEDAAKRMIEILDNYKGANGKTYKSDYRAILCWVVERYNNEKINERGNTKPLCGNSEKPGGSSTL